MDRSWVMKYAEFVLLATSTGAAHVQALDHGTMSHVREKRADMSCDEGERGSARAAAVQKNPQPVGSRKATRNQADSQGWS